MAERDEAANGGVVGVEDADGVAFGVGLFEVVEEEGVEGEGGEKGEAAFEHGSRIDIYNLG